MEFEIDNPYASPHVQPAHEVRTFGRQWPGRLSWRQVLLGLLIPGPTFGTSATFCLLAFAYISQVLDLATFRGLLMPSFRDLAGMVGIYSTIGSVVSLLTIPLLLLVNSRGGLRPSMAFAMMFALGTTAYIVFAIFGSEDSQERIAGLSPRTTMLLLFGAVFWLPSIVASLAYAVWIRWLTDRAKREYTS